MIGLLWHKIMSSNNIKNSFSSFCFFSPLQLHLIASKHASISRSPIVGNELE